LLRGGVFCYPAESERAEGKLRLLYEAGPLAFLITHAGGYASDGRQSILDIVPTDLHQRVALFLGNRPLVERLEVFIRQEEER
jgi:fructose-1,6-bisphosphatase I